VAARANQLWFLASWDHDADHMPAPVLTVDYPVINPFDSSDSPASIVAGLEIVPADGRAMFVMPAPLESGVEPDARLVDRPSVPLEFSHVRQQLNS
jgi:hypothetical protein